MILAKSQKSNVTVTKIKKRKKNLYLQQQKTFYRLSNESQGFLVKLYYNVFVPSLFFSLPVRKRERTVQKLKLVMV